MVAVAAPAVEPRLECSQLELSWAQRGGKGGGMSLPPLAPASLKKSYCIRGLTSQLPKWLTALQWSRSPGYTAQDRARSSLWQCALDSSR